MLHNLVLDTGNALIKGASSDTEISYPHAIAPIDETAWSRLTRREGALNDPDIVVINDIPYYVGELAENKKIMQRRTGASRYTRDYYGLFVAASLARLFVSSLDIFLFGSIAPGDIDYAEDMIHAALGEWRVEYMGDKMKFNIQEGSFFEEPKGGLMNVILSKNGKLYENAKIAAGTSLVLDIGGHTTDGVIVYPDGRVDYDSSQSFQLGILGVIKSFEKAFRTNHPELVKSVNKFLPEEVRKAVRTGKFDLRGMGVHSCQEEIDEASARIINSVRDIYYDEYGGPANYHTIILTGGGSALLESKLRGILDHPSVVLADKNPDEAHLANIRGGKKMHRFYYVK